MTKSSDSAYLTSVPVGSDDEDVLSQELRDHFKALKTIFPPKKRRRKGSAELKIPPILLHNTELKLAVKTAKLVEEEMLKMMNGIKELESLLESECGERTDLMSLQTADIQENTKIDLKTEIPNPIEF